MKIRLFSADDLNVMTDVWNRVFPKDRMTPDRFVQMAVCDENYDCELSLTAEENGEFLGYALGIYRKFPYGEKGMQEGMGWIPVLFVRPDCRRRGIGTALYDQLEKRMRDAGVREFTLASYSPFYFFPGVDEEWTESIRFFEKNGYLRNEDGGHFWMEQKLAEYRVPPGIERKKEEKIREGFEFRKFKTKDMIKMREFLNENFSVGWRRHVIDAVQRGTAEETVWICLYRGEIAGYVQRAMDGDPERYGPFGVGEGFRNRGIGSVLLHEMLLDMRGLNLEKAFFKSTEVNGRRLYERQGFYVKRMFYKYIKMGV